MDTTEITKLTTFIEENLRASPSAGIQFVDSRHLQSRLTSKQNHVIFGRRGAGKTTLVKSIRQSQDAVIVYLNLEDFKDITFPNIIIQVLIELFEKLIGQTTFKLKWYQFWKSDLRQNVKSLMTVQKDLRTRLHTPDTEIQEINEKEAYHSEIGASIGQSGISVSGRDGVSNAREISRTVPSSKIAYLRIELINF